MSFFLLAPAALAITSLGTFSETIGVGKTLSIGLNPSASGNWYVVSNSNPAVASAGISGIAGSSLVVKGLKAGNATVSACTESNGVNCLHAIVTVSGSNLGVSTSRHPSGSWILSGKTVYFVTDSGLVPISTWKIFLSNGGKAKLIAQATGDDLNLPYLDLMVLKDSRVK